MITAQDIREKGFEKSRINGYDMASVDDFLDEIADDVAAYQKENAVLKSKMKVLVDKIEEYRANEDALKASVLSAQKLALQIENEARTRSDEMIAAAEKQVKARLGGIEEETARYEQRLAEAKDATEKFLEAARSLCNTQLRHLDAIAVGKSAANAAPAKESARPADVDDAVRTIEESVSKIKPEPSLDIDLSDAMIPEKPKKNADRTQTFNLR